MLILYEQDSSFNVYSVTGTGSHTIRRQRFFGGLVDALRTVKKHDDRCFMLLDEKHFHYFTYTISLTSRDGFTIHEFKTILNEKLKQIRWQEGISTEYTVHNVQHCIINNEQTKHYIGKKGNISFDLHIIVLKNDQCRLIKQQCGSAAMTDNRFTIVPRSYYLIEYLKKTFGKDNHALLMINEETCTLLTIHRGFYSRLEMVNMGEKLLQACYKEHNIQQYLYQGYEQVESNSLLRRLVEESLQFYAKQLCTWLQQFLTTNSELLLISDLIKNPLFVSTINAHYHDAINGFIIPINTLLHTQGASTLHTAELPVMTTILLAIE